MSSSIFVGLSFLPTQILPFVKSGVFGWNGLITYWAAFVVYGSWIVITLLMTVKAIRREEAEEKAAYPVETLLPAPA